MAGSRATRSDSPIASRVPRHLALQPVAVVPRMTMARPGARTGRQTQKAGAEADKASLHPLDIPGLPALVNGGLGRRVQAQNREVASSRRRLHPVAFLTGGRLRTEVDVGAAIGIRLRLVT